MRRRLMRVSFRHGGGETVDSKACSRLGAPRLSRLSKARERIKECEFRRQAIGSGRSAADFGKGMPLSVAFLRKRKVSFGHNATEAPKEVQTVGNLRLGPKDAEILALLIPAIGSVFLDPAMQVIDTAIVGRLGPAPLGAVGLSNLVFFFCTVFFSFLLVVTTPRVANAVAGGDSSKASIATAQAMWVAIACGTLLGFAIWLGAPWLILKGFAAESTVAQLAVQHLQIRAIATPAVVVLFVVNGAFRGFRDTKTPLIAGIVQNLVNLALDLFLVGYLGWGVRGAAAAVSFAQYVGAAAMTGMLARRSMLQLSDLRTLPGMADTLEMLKPGVPLAFCMAALMTTVVTATNLASGLGTIALAAHTIVKQITDFCLGLLGTFSTVSQTLVASSLGKNDKKEARAFLLRLMQMAICFGSVLAASLFLGSSFLPGLFTQDRNVADMARQIIPFVAFMLPLAPCGTALEGALLGSLKVNWVGGRTVASALIALGILKWTDRSGWGLLGVWVGLTSLIACNFVGDVFRITRADSPIAAVLDASLSLSIDQQDEDIEFEPLEMEDKDKVM